MIDNKLQEICKALEMKFPIARISKDLEYSKGIVSEYYNNKKEISENFREQFENFYNVKFKDLIKKQSDVIILDNDEEVEIFRNKNGVNFYLYPDDSIKIEVSVIPFKAYASSQIECYFDENYINKEFSKIQFTVDKIGKGVYLGFKTKNDSMNGGGLYDTPHGAEVLGREIGRQHWLTLHKNDYGFVLMTKSAIMHKDITSYNSETGMFTLHSRNPSEIDFEVSINDIYRIFNVIKRTF